MNFRVDMAIQGTHAMRAQVAAQSFQSRTAGIAQNEIEIAEPAPWDVRNLLARTQCIECNRRIQVIEHGQRMVSVENGVSGGLCVEAIRGHYRQVAVRKLRSEEHTSELQSLMRNSYAVFCLKKKKAKEQTQ